MSTSTDCHEPSNVSTLELKGIPPGVCTRFIFGRCRYSPCRFSHDVDRAALLGAAAPQASRSVASADTAASRREEPAPEEVAAPPELEDGDHSVPAPPAKPWRSVDFLLRGRSVRSNPYLQEFAAAPWLPELLHAPECESLLNIRGKSLRKELSEAFGALHACRRALAKLGIDPEGSSCFTIVDLCCGKGLGSLVLAHSLPRVKVVAVDTNPDMELAHLRSHPNISFLALDITSPNAAAQIAEALPQASNTGSLLFVGVHLCGALSKHAIRLWSEAPAPAALVLVPCCMDGRRPDIKLRARKLRVDPHRYWCLSLLMELPSSAAFVTMSASAGVHMSDSSETLAGIPKGTSTIARRELFVDDDVMSAKNTFLIATRDAH